MRYLFLPFICSAALLSAQDAFPWRNLLRIAYSPDGLTFLQVTNINSDPMHNWTGNYVLENEETLRDRPGVLAAGLR